MRSLLSTILGSLLVLSACQRTEEPAPQANAAAPAAPVTSAPAGEVTMPAQAFQCGDLSVTATFDGVGSVDLSWPGGPLTLPQVEAASGARFADSQGNEFWNKGTTATLTLAGQQKRDCAPAAPAS